MPLVNRLGTNKDRDLSVSIAQLQDGKINSYGSLTLTENTTTTVVADRRVGTSSVILLMPKSANAAAAIGTTFVSSRGKQTFTLTHSNTATTDRNFDYVVLG